MSRIRRHWLLAGFALVALLMAAGLAVGAREGGWRALWGSPDQRGARLLHRGRFGQAAEAFADPVWRGVALMRAGRFKEAAQSFAAADTPEAAYDQGNALVMLGQYPEAVARYDRALALRPGWPDAVANRALAKARADRFAALQGEQADEEKATPDETYRRDRKRDESSQESARASEAMSDDAIRALWLRRVQTRPADFLRARFAYQLQQSAEPGAKR